ncbi:MAG: GDP-mannose 4,6-dehydratase [Acidobacteria bacterium]|nr:GDP-mannose 4,6-dehydratase [Acidobacteriota bacterium]
MTRALIVGISGQDGAYLAAQLLRRGYEVSGSSRDAQLASFANLERLGILQQVRMESISPGDFRSVLQALQRTEPDEVYFLAGQSSVGLSFAQPVETLDSIAVGALNLLEAIRFTGRPVRLYHAGSGECFGDMAGLADEETPFRPRSPYAVAKATATWLVANYREAYGIHACTGILFNHESPLRPERFVTRKIVAGVCRIAAGKARKLSLGNLAIRRDWGWAPEYTEAMWRMLQQPEPGDFVIATGASRSLQEFVACAFGAVGLDWREHVESDPGLLRPTELRGGAGDPRRARERLGWTATVGMEEVVARMVAAERGERGLEP